MLHSALNFSHIEIFHPLTDYLLTACHILDIVVGACNIAMKKTGKFLPFCNEYSTGPQYLLGNKYHFILLFFFFLLRALRFPEKVSHFPKSLCKARIQLMFVWSSNTSSKILFSHASILYFRCCLKC